MTSPRLPSCRNLDIYRLVTLRRWKQLDVASSFGISPVRVCQIVAGVHAWVAESLPTWFFQGRHDLRFLAALAYEKIRLLDREADPETVMLIGPGWTYKRENRVASLTDSQPRTTNAPTSAIAPTPSTAPPATMHAEDLHIAPEFSPHPLNFMPTANPDEILATSSDSTDCADSRLLQLAHNFARILILWKKTQRHASRPNVAPSSA